MPPLRSISVLMPTWQGAEFLERVLAALAAQEGAPPWDFLAVDSGSTDGTLEILERWRARFPVPFQVRSIHQVEFDHGDTRNLLAAESRGDLLVFLTQDAIPTSVHWLRKLAANFEDPRVGAAYCRNLPRPDAQLLTRVFSENDPGYLAGRREVRLPSPELYAAMNAHDRRLLYNFNDVASAIPRALWKRHPFPRAEFGEDLLMARALLEAGFTVVYDDEATVEHSHDYTGEQMLGRARIDARFNAEWLDRTCVESRADAEALVERQLARDREALEAAGITGPELKRELSLARELRRAAFVGLYEGGLTRRRHAPTRLLERESLHVLFVVHGFPPDTWAGTEVYTLTMAQELERLGHRCTILARAPAAKPVAEGGPEDFSLELGEFQGLRVWRMTHRLEHRRIRDTYAQPRAEQAFRELLARERPDVVHFQHLIHLSAGLVHVAKEFGLPTVLHCHDYWALCARVQLIRPDGVRCEENMGSGCFLCVKEHGLNHIGRLKRLDRAAGPMLDALGAGLRTAKRLGAKSGRWDGFADLRGRQESVLGAYAAADLRISPSRFLREKMLASGAFEPHTFLYSDNGMRTDHVRALRKVPDPQGRVRLGFVGSLVWYKGADVLVEAMNQLEGTRAVLNVHGDFQPDKDPHHARLRELARAGNVHFRGRFDNARLSEVYSEIDVLVVPSVWFENSPITIHEAFLTRTPVVASDLGGMREFVRDGVDGLRFAVGDPAALARTLRRFLDEPDLIPRLSRDFPRVKTAQENARELEFRYRALCCRKREGGARILLDYRGIDALAKLGPPSSIVQQGADMLLLRPGGSAVEYDVALARGGRREIALEVRALGGERTVQLGGRVLLDGAELGRIAPFRSSGSDETRTFRFTASLGPSSERLRVEPVLPGGGECCLRIARVVLREVPATGGDPAAPSDPLRPAIAESRAR
jgi:glycosyltransferase involved in cell wall biosynthesis